VEYQLGRRADENEWIVYSYHAAFSGGGSLAPYEPRTEKQGTVVSGFIPGGLVKSHESLTLMAVEAADDAKRRIQHLEAEIERHIREEARLRGELEKQSRTLQREREESHKRLEAERERTRQAQDELWRERERVRSGGYFGGEPSPAPAPSYHLPPWTSGD
jgi:hypothetical protein